MKDGRINLDNAEEVNDHGFLTEEAQILKEIPFSNSNKLHNEMKNIVNDNKKLAKSAFTDANEYYEGAALIFNQDIQLAKVVSVNLAFACELYLKAMLYEFNIDFNLTHCLINLYKLLPKECQKLIAKNVHFKYEKDNNFELVLEEISDAFIFLRYSHERKAVVSNVDGLIAISKSLKKISGEIIERRPQ